MAITSDFSIFANTDFSTTPFQYLIFARKAPLLHVELNELQYLGFMRDRVIMKALGNKCIGSITRDSNTKKTAIKGDFIIDGYAIANLDTTINTETGDSIYFKVTLEEVTKDSELTKNGVAYIYISLDAQRRFGLTSEQASNSVAYLNSLKGSIIWIAFIENEDGSIRVRLRSRFVTINQLAESYGGGGHAQASGATIYSLAEMRGFVRRADKLIEQYKSENDDWL